MPDTTVYIHRLQRRAPTAILDLLSKRTVLHASVALSEISISLGALDPGHPETARNRAALLGLLKAIGLNDCRAPSAAAWIEAGALAGILARTQLGLPRASAKLTAEQRQANKDRCRRLLNDALMFLTAREQEIVLISGNVNDMDVMLRLNPGVRVLLYRPAALVS